jgi:hypothetical protein
MASNVPGGRKKRSHFNLSNLAEALIQSDLQEHFGLSALLKGRSTHFSFSQFGIRTGNLS